MTDEKQTETNFTPDETLMSRRKAKEEALMHYINEQNEEKQDLIPDENKTLKGAFIGFFYTLYLVLIYPVLSDKALKKKLLKKIIFAIIIVLLASWFSPVLKYEVNKTQLDVTPVAENMP